MTIAVHINVSRATDDPIKDFNYNCFSILAHKYPGDHFIFISDKPLLATAIRETNITPVVLTPAIRSSLLSIFWYNFKLPRLLSKYNVDLFVGKDAVCSSRVNIPQCIIINDLSFLQKKGTPVKNEARYLKKYFAAFVTQAKKILLTNDFIKTELVTRFPLAGNKIGLTCFGLPEIFSPCNYASQEQTRQSITGGKEYFLFQVTEATWSNIVMMLKAFSAFKKWQKSNMQLVLLFGAAQTEKQIKDFGTYKYRDEVRVVYAEKHETSAAVISAAYATIYLPFWDIAASAGISVLKSGTPLITSDSGFCKAVYGDAALYAGFHEKNISEKMMLVYKDENLRSNLISRGTLLAMKYTWENTVDQLWPILLDSLE